jgi:ABC-2 type transport system permease protein
MRGFWPIFKRELMAYFVTPLAWVAMTAFLLLQGLHFFLIVRNFAGQIDAGAAANPVQNFFGETIMIYLPLLFVCPVLTMRMFAEERRSGTIETLLTAPVETPAVVLAKYCAVAAVYTVMWVPTAVYMLILGKYGDVDWNVVGSGYFSVMALGLGYLAIGTMTSALSRSQLGAALLSAMCIMGLFMLGIGEFIFGEGPWRELASHVSAWGHMNDFSRGIIDSRRLVFDATLIALPLFITVRAVEAWRVE